MKSLFKIAQASGYARSGSTAPDGVGYSVVKSGKGKASMFTIGHRVAHRMRWMVGDRVDVLYDEQLAEGQLVRCREGGWQLCGNNTESSPLRFRLHLRPEFGLPDVPSLIDLAIDLTDTTIVFAFPTQYRKPIKV